MKCKMLETTNESFEYLIGIEGSCRITKNIWIDYPDGRFFHTSKIKTIKFKYYDNYTIMYVKTKNSVYKFKV